MSVRDLRNKRIKRNKPIGAASRAISKCSICEISPLAFCRHPLFRNPPPLISHRRLALVALFRLIRLFRTAWRDLWADC